MSKDELYLKISDILMRFDILSSEYEEFNYPSKYDAFSIGNYIRSLNIICNKSMISEEELKIKMRNPLVYHDNNGFIPYDIYQMEKDNYLWVQNDSAKEPMISFEIKENFKVWNLIFDKTNTCGKYAFEYCTKLFPYAVLDLEGIVLHGVLIEYNNKGIIISAPSGTGKTTHARMWRDTQRALIINGDRALCRKIEGKWIGFGMPWCGTSGEYINRDVEISAIVVLEQAKENSVEKLDTLQSFNHMIPNITAPTWEKNLLNKAMDYLEDIVNEVPVYKLKCTPDIEAVEVLKKEIDKL